MSSTTKVDFSELADRWPSPYVARTDTHLEKFGGGLLPSARSMANLDSSGQGPKGKVRLGRKVAYRVQNLIEWMEKRAEAGNI